MGTAYWSKDIHWVRNYNAADIEGLADELNITIWDDLVFNSDNINDVYSNFLKILDDAVKKYIPTKTITVIIISYLPFKGVLFKSFECNFS
jgi:hypothetical protein